MQKEVLVNEFEQEANEFARLSIDCGYSVVELQRQRALHVEALAHYGSSNDGYQSPILAGYDQALTQLQQQ